MEKFRTGQVVMNQTNGSRRKSLALKHLQMLNTYLHQQLSDIDKRYFLQLGLNNADTIRWRASQVPVSNEKHQKHIAKYLTFSTA